ncbi:hypothetical protein NUW54_g6796 [Trametes sanguinea]|uniref:Uncharacterized protein n=1 Tax=Trametes sanguinea TaxID=158606 RepID=A0ACC1PSP4_9APHY|nr:hypothetical protein NUW54_g6796 [Trametes sanguinea]
MREAQMPTLLIVNVRNTTLTIVHHSACRCSGPLAAVLSVTHVNVAANAVSAENSLESTWAVADGGRGCQRVLPKPTRNSRVKQKRPRSRTLTQVHEKILEDLVFPTEIVGKRTRVAVDGSKLLKVFLDSKDATSLEYKLDSFSSVYRRLTGKDVVFEFPVQAQD